MASPSPLQLSLLLPLLLLPLAGCHSAMVEATIHNGSPAAVKEVEVDYPSASFGIQTLAPGGDFHYRFKILGSGPVKLTYLDATGHPHSSSGPDLHENEEGPLLVTIDGPAARWTSQVHDR